MNPQPEASASRRFAIVSRKDLQVLPGSVTEPMPLRGQNPAKRRDLGRGGFVRIEEAMLVLLTILAVVLADSCSIQKPTSERTVPPYLTLPPVPSFIPEPTHIPEPTVVDTGLAYGVPCSPPCWQGLIPGKTPREEAARVLEELWSSGVVEDVLDTGGTSDGAFIVQVASRTETLAMITFDRGVIESIDGDVNFDYTIGDLVAAFGPPEGIFGQVETGSGKCLVCPESVTGPIAVSDVWVSLVYPKQGLYFRARIQGHLLGCICPEMSIGYFCYYLPQSMEDRIENNRDKCSAFLSGYTLADMAEWHGFGGGY